MIGDAIRRGALVLAGIVCAVAGAQASPLPRCASHIEVAGMKILRVEKNGVLVLHDGRAVDMEGILLPRGRRDHAPWGPARQALAAARAMADHHRVTLMLERPKEDRYGRLRAQIFFPHDAAQPWLQVMLLRRGLARVNIAPDRRECARELYAAERHARAARVGIWALRAYRVRRPGELERDIGTFQIVEGKILTASVRGGRAYLNFGPDWHSDFTATIAPDDMKLFRRVGLDPRTLAGKRVRVRGWVQSMNGPEIELSAPEQIEVLP